jgi:hypothetical protein
MNFQGDVQISIFEGDLVFNLIKSETFKIYSYNHPSNFQLSFSDMTEPNSGDIIASRDITLADTSIPSSINTQNPKVVSISINDYTNLNYGIYYGTLFVTDGADRASIPYTIDVTPPLSKTIILVVDGIALSIVLWKLVAYFNLQTKYTNSKLYTAMLNPKKALFEEKGPILYATEPNIFGRNLILDIATLLFGITIGLIELPVSETILNIHDIGNYQVLALIALGMGIGSLKELITKNEKP